VVVAHDVNDGEDTIMYRPQAGLSNYRTRLHRTWSVAVLYEN